MKRQGQSRNPHASQDPRQVKTDRTRRELSLEPSLPENTKGRLQPSRAKDEPSPKRDRSEAK